MIKKLSFSFVFVMILWFNCINLTYAEKPSVFKVGAILPLTGNLAWIGVPEKNALLLALEEIKKEGGTPDIELIIEDSKGDVKNAVTVANKLISVDKVSALIVSLSKINKAVAPISQQNNIVHIATTTSDPSINDIGKNVFRIYENFATEQSMLAKWAKKNNYNNISLLRTNDYAINQAATIFMENAKKQNIRIVDDVIFEPGTLDFRTQTEILKRKQQDAVLLMGYGPEYIPILKTFKELKFTPKKILGMYTFLSLVGKQEASDLLDGIEFVSFYKTTTSKDVQPFIKEYEKKFGQKPGDFINYLFTYDAFRILCTTTQNITGELTTDNITNSILQIKNYKGISGNITILPSRDTIVDMAVVTYKNNQLIVLENEL